jgi:polar amino acid transport system permease protein
VRADAAAAGAEVAPAAYDAEIPRGSLGLLLAAWLLLVEGALGLIFLPIIVITADARIPPGDIAAFAALSVATAVGGGLLYSRWPVSWWLALTAGLGSVAWLVVDRGLTSWNEVVIAGSFTVAAVVLLVVGRRAAGRPEAMALASAQIPFRVKLALVWVGIVFVLSLFFALAGFDTQFMRDRFGYIASGLPFTIAIAVGAILLAMVLALLGALGRLSSNPIAFGVSGFYTSFFRGTPLIVQLFLIYLALPQIGSNLGSRNLTELLTLTAFQAGILGLGLNYGAYMTEIFRAGIQSVGHGQSEAADALAMSYAQKMRRVVLPQAVRVIIPPTGNEFIAMMKDTALVSFLGVAAAQAELFRRAQLAGKASFRNLEAFLVAAALYWGLTTIFSFFQGRLERRLSRGYVRAAAAPGRRRGRLLPGGRPAGPANGAGGTEVPAHGH